MNLPFQMDHEEKITFKPPHITFRQDSEKDNLESVKQGRVVTASVIKVFIRSPGDDKCEVPYIVERTIRDPETGKKITDYPWLRTLKEKRHHGFISHDEFDYYERALAHWRKTQETLIEGTSVMDWSQLTKSEAENLRSLGILSIEQASEMNEAAIDAYGPIGGRVVKEKAIAWINSNNSPGKASEQIVSLEAKVKQSDEKAEQADLNLSAMAQKVAMLQKMIEDQSKVEPKVEAKVEVAVEAKAESTGVLIPSEDTLEVMDMKELVSLAQKKSITASKHWKRETLIRKILS